MRMLRTVSLRERSPLNSGQYTDISFLQTLSLSDQTLLHSSWTATAPTMELLRTTKRHLDQASTVLLELLRCLTPRVLQRVSSTCSLPYPSSVAHARPFPPFAGKKAKRALPSHMIQDMSAGLAGSTPYGESTSGLSVTVDPSLSSGTARHLKAVEEYEMSNFTRMRMSKKDAKKRRNEEEEVAFGGLGAGKGGKRRLGGFGAEFDDLLGDMGGDRAQGAYESMKAMKRPKLGGSGGLREKDESAGTSGLAGLVNGGKARKGKSKFDKAVSRAGSKSRS